MNKQKIEPTPFSQSMLHSEPAASHISRRTQLTVAVTSAAVVLMLTVGIAAANNPVVSSTPIHACVTTSTGAVQIVSSGQSCAQSQYPVSWNGPGMESKGAWSASSSYASGDVVTYAGSSWIAVAASANKVPGANPSDWSQLTSIGQPGPHGDTGAPGPRGYANTPGLYIVQSGTHAKSVYLSYNHAGSDGWIPVTGMIIKSPGPYAVFAKLDVYDDQGSNGNIECRLTAGADSDVSNVILSSGSENYDQRSISLNLVHTFPGFNLKQDTVDLACNPNGDLQAPEVSNITITAVRAGTLINSPLH